MARMRFLLLPLVCLVAATAAGACASAEPPFTSTARQVSDSPLAAIDFVDPTHGWAVGGSHGRVTLAQTSDGQSWRSRTLPVAGRPTDVAFVDKLHGWVAVDASAAGDTELVILRTSDGGRRWRLSRVPGVSPYDGGFSFTGPREGWFVGAREDLRLPVVLRTGDGGASWRTVEVTDRLVTLTSVVFQDPPLQGWISGYDNQRVGTPTAAFTTLDGGAAWDPLHGDAAPHSALFRLDDAHLWALGETDGRAQMLRLRVETGAWEPVGSTGDVPTLFAFGSADVGWGIRFETGEEGAVAGWRLLLTEDGGGTWLDAGVEIPAEPTDIACPAADGAVIATRDGLVVSVTR